MKMKQIIVIEDSTMYYCFVTVDNCDRTGDHCDRIMDYYDSTINNSLWDSESF